MHRHRRILTTVAGSTLTTLLAACGGGSGPINRHASEAPVGPPASLTLLARSSSAHSVTGVSAATMATIRSLLQQRAEANGIRGITISVTGTKIVLSAPASYAAALRRLGTVPLLRFRQLLEVGPFQPASLQAPEPTHEAGGPIAQDAEAPTLTPSLKAAFDRWSCAENPNPSGNADNPVDYLIACDPSSPAADANLKYLLAPASVEGSQVKDAEAGLTANGSSWVVTVRFTSSGTSSWFALTKRAYEATNSGSSGFGSCTPPKGCNAVSIVLGGVVRSAPAVEQPGIPGGIAQITGDFNQQEADNLADILKLDALPVFLQIVNFEPAS
ncbi:MAG TPA: hypothetical protein VHC43_05415 [Mycobacteriales bacterium]|nr:hypothetical protein [Mycobacteriales bacterium]